ncbi:hypothetical protein AwDysgo_02170 [Bacteroidales bacterium]|nr:hypothetical protein AwDysgo_02170 [Bacteroidales bacterium]
MQIHRLIPQYILLIDNIRMHMQTKTMAISFPFHVHLLILSENIGMFDTKSQEKMNTNAMQINGRKVYLSDN